MSVSVYIRKFGRPMVTLGLVIMVTLGVAFGSTKLLTIQTIEVEGSGIQIAIDQRKIPKNLLFFPSDQIREALLSENPLLGEVIIKKKFPHTLVIMVYGRIPIARLQIQGRSVDLDSEGVVLGESVPGINLPILFFDASPRIGEVIRDPQVLTSISIVTACKKITAIDSITALDGLSLWVKSGTLSIYIAQQSDINAKAATLQVLLTGFRIKGRLPTLIDLRFSKPVVTF